MATTETLVYDVESDDAPRLLGVLMPPLPDDEGNVTRYYYGPDEEVGSAPHDCVALLTVDLSSLPNA
jgi:hypothetical protein